MKNVSIVVPTYGRAFELERYLFPSILKQTVKPYEVIIVDDTPNDTVEKICSKWRHIFQVDLRYIRNVRGRSLARARNYALEIAQGELLMFLDSDVVLDTKYLEKIVRAFEEKRDIVGAQGYIINRFNRNSIERFSTDSLLNSVKYAIYISFFRIFLGNFVPSSNSCRLFEYPIALEKDIHCDWLSGSNMALKKNIFELVKFENSLMGYSLGEDLIFSTKLRKYGKMYLIHDAKCLHMVAKTGRPDRKDFLIMQENMFKYLGLRGWVIIHLGKIARTLKSHLYYHKSP
jgi:cellulose synthase/poly-beta-1,6-N-acetylglucosamine synthase-like glycosyltransferase